MDVTDIRKKEEGRKKKEEGRKPFDFAQGTKKEEKTHNQLIGKIMFWVDSCFLILS
jgi:hypothetical protein